MKWKLAAMFLGVSLALAACGGGGDNAGNNNGNNGGGDTAASAEQIYKQNCASCHGQDLSGGVGPNLQKVGSKYSKEQIKEIIANGRGAMPAGIIKGEDADKVAEWLASKK
ncbi:cytochrome c551 [Geobacillus sp. FSL K6-0789]|uniref:Cytochrome c n=1 Tax=Geobacillus stearothermophilus TaxID=1422 RepID=Q8GID2_GEOSE|nr:MULTISPECIES: c-type cytochrome [Geobacillus]KAF6509618.1 Membrane-attached cytochrome c550 [Geobacillus stearothermophilus]KMY58971.1 cytochrome C551 [Geobacillus stearothermophilus]KMY61053.1 cytochrome C551 [Geobacillus stearothermophilus]KMY61296.1 cytochrome C551 [Geobacillus stearothermophilus]KQC45993.1 cytochrome C551 [Geobacillus sp. Sah69]